MSTPITVVPSRTTRAYAWIDAAYEALQKTGTFLFRIQQKELSYSVAKALIEGQPLVAEAPTGTGKTLAYLIGALASSETAMGSVKDPVVVSTATKILQS